MVDRDRVRVYYRVGDEPARSTTWQLWMHRTSVYFVNNAVGGIRVRLHGRDDRHPGAEHFRVEPDDRRNLGAESRGDVVLLPPADGWPLRFGGKRSALGQHAIRIRTTAPATDIPAPPATRGPRQSSATCVVPAPTPEWAADLDLVFEQLPRGLEPVGYRGPAFEFDHAGVHLAMPMRNPIAADRPGFLMRNTYGIVLRGETHLHRLDIYPTPPHLLVPQAEASDSATRAIAIDSDDDGLLWIVEQTASASAGPQDAN